MTDQVIGKLFKDRYQVQERIGAGGMAVVYRGEDVLLKRPVAIKILREQFLDDEQNVRFFQNEARAVATMSHPNIVKIYDIGKEGPYYYIVMEYLEGQTLKDLLAKNAPMQPVEAIDILCDVLRALAHSHKKGIIHRDIKPHNIIICEDTTRVKVTDFGIARHTGAATATYSGQMVGSVYYISPEQAKGYRTTHATDIYSTGVMLYEMLTGRVPFQGDNPVGIALSHVQKEPVPVTEINPRIPVCLEEVVSRAMQKQPADRYRSAAEMARALLDVRTLIRQGKAPRRVDRRKRYMAAGLTGIAALVVVAAVFGQQVVRHLQPREVPLLVGQHVEEAGEVLSELGFSWEIEQTIKSDEYDMDYVLAQTPADGTRVPVSRTILLTLSEGPELFQVPNVVSLREREAVVALENRLLEYEIRYEYSPDGRHARGYVMEQDPGGGEELRRGGVVFLTVSQGVQPGEKKMADLRGLTLVDAEPILTELGLGLGEISYETSHLYFLGRIADQGIPPGQMVRSGTRVDLVISRGPGMSVAQKDVAFTVPGEMAGTIIVMVEDASGVHQAYQGEHQGGEQLRITVDHLGGGTAKVYLGEQLLQEIPLP